MRCGIIHNYFSESDLADFPQDAFIHRLRETFNAPLELQVWHHCWSPEPVTPHVDTHFEGVPNYMQFLVPDNVDGDPALCSRTSTVVAGEDIQWQRGSLLWWHSDLTHWSGEQNKTRTCWVIQTRLAK